MIKYLKSVMSASGDASWKRFIGTVCVVSLISGMYLGDKIKCNQDIVDAVKLIALTCVAGTVTEKFLKDKPSDPIEPDEGK